LKNRIVAQKISSKYHDSDLYECGRYTKLEKNKSYLTWKNFDIKYDVEFSWIKSRGSSVASYLERNPDKDLDAALKRYQSCLRAAKQVGQDLSYNSIEDAIPDFILKDYLSMMNEVSQRVWTESEMSTEEYNTLKNNHIVSLMCSKSDLRFDSNWVSKNLHSNRLRQFMSRKAFKKIRYDIFGTRTGRFATSKSSFPILSLDKSFRSLLVPKNDLFAVFDFNAAEVRTLLSLSGLDQPENDIHEWNRKNILNSSCSRSEAKQSFFAWLYNPDSQGPFDNYYDRKTVLQKYWDSSGFVQTPFGRKISSTDRLSLNYLLQSSTNDAIMESLVKAMQSLEGFQGSIAFVVHDSVVLDCTRADAAKLNLFKKNLEETRFGKYQCSFHIGKNFGELRRVS
tara:strand:+ start:28219 stop:29403 length:1185 start_codon:yes stop_codon:yes gene_type:complete